MDSAIEKVSIIVSKGSLEGIYPALIMANGARPGILDSILAGEPVGTLFLPQGQTLPAWKRVPVHYCA